MGSSKPLPFELLVDLEADLVAQASTLATLRGALRGPAQPSPGADEPRGLHHDSTTPV